MPRTTCLSIQNRISARLSQRKYLVPDPCVSSCHPVRTNASYRRDAAMKGLFNSTKQHRFLVGSLSSLDFCGKYRQTVFSQAVHQQNQLSPCCLPSFQLSLVLKFERAGFWLVVCWFCPLQEARGIGRRQNKQRGFYAAEQHQPEPSAGLHPWQGPPQCCPGCSQPPQSSWEQQQHSQGSAAPAHTARTSCPRS